MRAPGWWEALDRAVGNCGCGRSDQTLLMAGKKSRASALCGSK